MAEASKDAASAGATTEPVEIVVDDTQPSTTGAGDEDDFSTTSTSLKSSILKYEFKHGRRYHAYQSGSYSFPNDDQEQERLDMIHHVFFRLMNERLFLAPIGGAQGSIPDSKEKGKSTEETKEDEEPPTVLAGLKILDIGTGTGLWPIHLGDTYPDAAQVVGNDLSPIQPQWVPPNVKFVVDDVEADWVDQEGTYDFIHCRYMAGSIKDWPRLVRQIFKALKPGGWVEFQESANTLFSEDGTLTPENPMVQMMNGLMEACDKIGRTMDPAPSMEGWVKDAGFEDVKVAKFKLPVGSWPKDKRLKEIGMLMSVNFIEGVEAFTAVLFGDVLGWKQEEVTALNEGVRSAARDRRVHPIFNFLVVMGRKPE